MPEGFPDYWKNEVDNETKTTCGENWNRIQTYLGKCKNLGVLESLQEICREQLQKPDPEKKKDFYHNNIIRPLGEKGMDLLFGKDGVLENTNRDEKALYEYLFASCDSSPAFLTENKFKAVFDLLLYDIAGGRTENKEQVLSKCVKWIGENCFVEGGATLTQKDNLAFVLETLAKKGIEDQTKILTVLYANSAQGTKESKVLDRLIGIAMKINQFQNAHPQKPKTEKEWTQAIKKFGFKDEDMKDPVFKTFCQCNSKRLWVNQTGPGEPLTLENFKKELQRFVASIYAEEQQFIEKIINAKEIEKFAKKTIKDFEKIKNSPLLKDINFCVDGEMLRQVSLDLGMKIFRNESREFFEVFDKTELGQQMKQLHTDIENLKEEYVSLIKINNLYGQGIELVDKAAKRPGEKTKEERISELKSLIEGNLKQGDLAGDKLQWLLKKVEEFNKRFPENLIDTRNIDTE